MLGSQADWSYPEGVVPPGTVAGVLPLAETAGSLDMRVEWAGGRIGTSGGPLCAVAAVSMGRAVVDIGGTRTVALCIYPGGCFRPGGGTVVPGTLGRFGAFSLGGIVITTGGCFLPATASFLGTAGALSDPVPVPSVAAIYGPASLSRDTVSSPGSSSSKALLAPSDLIEFIERLLG
jgi:hypothetical protein